MRRDAIKFLLAVSATIFLLAGVVYTSHRKTIRLPTGSAADLEKIERMMERGVVSDKEASWWERAEGEERP